MLHFVRFQDVCASGYRGHSNFASRTLKKKKVTLNVEDLPTIKST